MKYLLCITCSTVWRQAEGLAPLYAWKLFYKTMRDPVTYGLSFPSEVTLSCVSVYPFQSIATKKVMMLTKKEGGKVIYLLELENLKALIPLTSTHPPSLRCKLRGIRKIPRWGESRSQPEAITDINNVLFCFVFSFSLLRQGPTV